MERPLSGLAQALSALGKGSAIRAELCRALAPIHAYDRRTGSDLARTLRVYVECGSLAETAERLFLHRNSVLYRLQRIQDISGIDPRERAMRLVLLVAYALADPVSLDPEATQEKGP